MVVDAFIFLNELDLLEIRLNTLSDIVDKFVLVESAFTFQGAPKAFFFEESRARFSPFLDRIEYIRLDQPPSPNPWDNEKRQREAIAVGLEDCPNDATILLSDADEIPNPKRIDEFRNPSTLVRLEQSLYYYYLNGFVPSIIWPGTKVFRKGDLQRHGGIQRIREAHDQIVLVNNGGWHFSYLGGAESISYKLSAFAHTEFTTEYFRNQDRIEKVVAEGGDIFDRSQRICYVEIDSTFPQYLIENQDRFGHLIRPISKTVDNE